jgi:hypothetical protein
METMEPSELRISSFQEQAERLAVSAWREIVSRGQAAARDRLVADEIVSEQLAEASMAIARKRRTVEEREAQKAQAWRVNDRNTAIARAIAAQVSPAEQAGMLKAIAILLQQVTVTIRVTPRLKKTAAGKAAMATLWAPFDGFVEVAE